MDRLERQREGIGAGSWFMNTGAPWPEHKDRQPDQRLVCLFCRLFYSIDKSLVHQSIS